MRFFPLLTLLVVLVMSGCKTSNDVVSDGLFQKRKHRPGYHLNWAQRSKHHQADVKEERRQWTSTDSTSMDPQDERSGSRKLQPLKRILSADTGPLHPSVLSPRKLNPLKKWQGKSLRETADERSEELEELLDHKIRNERNLKITGILSALSLAAYIIYYVSILMAVPMAPALGLVVIPFTLLLRYTFPLLIIYIIERLKLKNDELFFNEKRIRFFEDTTLAMKRVQLLTFIISLLSVIGFILGLLYFPAAALLSLLTFGISIFILGLASWIGIVTALAVKRFSRDAKRALIQLIILQILGNILLVFMAVLFLLLLFGALTGGIVI